MPLESQWARIPLGLRWAIALAVGVAAMVAIILFVSHNDGNGLAHVSERNLAREDRQAKILIDQDQAPQTVPVTSAATAVAQLEAGIRREMRRRIASGNVDGPLGTVRCGPAGRAGDRIGYHCLAEANSVRYPFLAVAVPATHRAMFCKKDFPPIPSENIPVSPRCRL